jgi:hypothetical protein
MRVSPKFPNVNRGQAKKSVMESEAKPPFDPVAFLAQVGVGKTILNYQRLIRKSSG